MNRSIRSCLWLAAMAAVAVVCSPVSAQPPAAAAAKPKYRKLAPGVMLSVDPARKLEESFSRHDIVELLVSRPDFDWARAVPFRHEIWNLQLKFKPMRMIRVDIPQPSGVMESKLIWYIIYSVTNKSVEEQELNIEFETVTENGEPKIRLTEPQPMPQYGWLQPLELADGNYKAKSTNKPIRFIPRFLLEGHESVEKGTGFSKVYADRVIPVAVARIGKREDPKRAEAGELFNTVEMCRTIAPGQTFWGVATWESIDPRIDRFSVYVEGLTNAYRWRDDEGGYQAGKPIGTGRRLSRKTLKLNFWRPGDEFNEHEREIYYGIPGRLNGDPREVDYSWVYQ